MYTTKLSCATINTLLFVVVLPTQISKKSPITTIGQLDTYAIFTPFG